MPQRKFRLYLDTSVISVYFDEKAEERILATQEFWALLPQYDVYVSSLTLEELNKHPDPVRQEQMRSLISSFALLEIDQEVENLADEYVKQGVFPKAKRADALHVAIASVHRMDILASWNYKHIVRLRTKQLLAEINPALGYPTLQIISPLEV